MLIFFWIIIIQIKLSCFQCQQITITEKCNCTQFQTMNECETAFCDWNVSQSKCTSQQLISNKAYTYCEQFNNSFQCPYESQCTWDGKNCTLFTTCKVYQFSTLADCQHASKQCVSNGRYCAEKGPCSSYNQDSIYCNSNKDKNGNYCYWNDSEKTGGVCDKVNSCEKLKIQSQTDQICRSILNTCTSDGINCIESGINCSDQLYQSACVTNRNQNQKCIWIQQKCYDITCEMAPNSLTKDDECRNFFKFCKSKPEGGCQQRSTCINAKVQTDCSFDSNQNIECFWNEGICMDKICENAPNTYKTNQECQSFLQNCITNGKGCVSNISCESALIKSSCQKTTQDKLCFWDNNKCQLDPCQAASNLLKTNEECISYSTYCIAKLNGGCQLNTSCDTINIETACIKDTNQNPCFWNNNKCQNRICQNAPIQYNTLELCQQFLSTYSISDQGVCVDLDCQYIKNEQTCTQFKHSCNDSSNENCSTSNSTQSCQWDGEKQVCKKKSKCEEYQGLDHFSCQLLDIKCTIGKNLQCAEQTTCALTNLKIACIEGIDGPCLWIDNYQNLDGTKGSCFRYDSCESIKWTTDVECKRISPNCTTDGIKCIGIEYCGDTNINGCFTGIDGACYKVNGLCKVFSSCEEIQIFSLEECQQVDKSCIYFKGQNSCSTKQQCNKYTENQCLEIIDNGEQRNENGEIIITGKCIWDGKQCYEESCNDFQFKTEEECKAKLVNCTSNGIKCLYKKSCSQYSLQLDCENTFGLDGICFWNISECKAKKCEEQVTEINCSKMQNCTYKENKCIQKSNSCNQQQNLEDCQNNNECQWVRKKQKCQKIQNYQTQLTKSDCDKQKNVYFWHDKLQKCLEHTCESHYQIENQCNSFFTSDKFRLNICILSDEQCVLVHPKQLNQSDCYLRSEGYFAWNISQNICSRCAYPNFLFQNGQQYYIQGTQNEADELIYEFHFGQLQLKAVIILIFLIY